MLEWWARVPVRVDAATVEVGEVPPQPAFAVSGRITSPGAKTAEDWSKTGVQLLAPDDGEHCGSRDSWTPVVAGGEFTVMTMPGRFRLCAWPHDRPALAESTLNGQDIVDLPFTVGGDVRGVRVLAARGTGPPARNCSRPRRTARCAKAGLWCFLRPPLLGAGRRRGRAIRGRARVCCGSVPDRHDCCLPSTSSRPSMICRSTAGRWNRGWRARLRAQCASTLGRSETRTLSPMKLRTVPVERAPVREYRRVHRLLRRLEPVLRPSFEAGNWTLDVARSSATGGGRGQVDTVGGGRGGGLGLGPSAESLDIRQTSELAEY